MTGINVEVLEDIIQKSNNFSLESKNYLDKILNSIFKLTYSCKGNSFENVIPNYNVEKKYICDIKNAMECSLFILNRVKKSYIEQDETFSLQLNSINGNIK